MARIIARLAFAAVLALVSTCALAQSSSNDRHLACYTAPDGTVWQLESAGSTTSLSKTPSGGATQTKSYNAALSPAPAAGAQCTDCIKAANYMESQNFFPTTHKVTGATYSSNAATRADVFNLTTKEGDVIVFASTSCAGWVNCAYAGSGGQNGLHCWSDTESCCGYGSMSPRCQPKSTTDKCCTHYLAATTCNSTQTCCGASGPGASSYAFCCNEGSTCCQSAVSYSGSASCCPAGGKCCRAQTFGYCCRADQDCDTASYSCKATAAPATA